MLKETMKIHWHIVVTTILCTVWLRQSTYAQGSNTTGVRWACMCASAPQLTQRAITAENCSASCDCELETDGSTTKTWMCACDHGLLPTLAAVGQNSKCFTACNCTSGSFSDTHDHKRHFRNLVVIVLLVCLLLTTFALIATFVCCYYQRGKYQPQKFMSDKGSSYNSATDLIRHRSLSASVSTTKDGVLGNSLTGCINMASCLFRKRLRTIRGAVTNYSYSELECATDKFSDTNLIGVGGSSHVYRGHLRDGRTVAVKRLKTTKGLDSDSEFSTEVEIISRLNHCHIVPLLGYSSTSLGKQNERLLVFEYLPNGNLRDCLDGISGKYLSWSTRVSIALGAARGLEYLHEAAAPRILHRDVKSTNILLDENWKAKVTDLGMAKHLTTDGFPSCSSSPERIKGTFGYFAPEYAIVGKGSLKSDVFSFGVVLLELITGRTPIFTVTDKGDESLVIWAAPRLQNSKRVITELPDPHLKGQFPEEELQILAYLAKECLLLDPDSRPGMSEVVQIISTIAPNASKQRRFSVNIFQNLSSSSVKNQESILSDKTTNQVEVLVDSEEVKQMCSRWSSGCSLSSDIDRTLLANTVGEEISLSSVQYVDRLLFLTSNGSSTNGNEEEVVDLTEPRLETFCIGNGQ